MNKLTQAHSSQCFSLYQPVLCIKYSYNIMFFTWNAICFQRERISVLTPWSKKIVYYKSYVWFFFLKLTISKQLSDNNTTNFPYGQALQSSCKLQWNVVQQSHQRHSTGRKLWLHICGSVLWAVYLGVIVFHRTLLHLCFKLFSKLFLLDMYLSHWGYKLQINHGIYLR